MSGMLPAIKLKLLQVFGGEGTTMFAVSGSAMWGCGIQHLWLDWKLLTETAHLNEESHVAVDLLAPAGSPSEESLILTP